MRFLLPILLAAAAPAGHAQGSQSARAPGDAGDVGLPQPGNVLVLVADDLGADQLSFYRLGSDYPPTPNLARMAANGVVFTSAWSLPTCSPTRAALLTGRQPFRTGIGMAVDPFRDPAGLAREEVTLPELLDLGTGGRYAHALLGKWHLTPLSAGDLAPNEAGFGHFAGFLEGQIASYTNWRRVVNGVVSTSTRYATSAAVDDALAWIGAQRSPWFCLVAFQAPHAPYHEPPRALHTQHLPSGPPRSICSQPTGNDPRLYYKAMIEALDTELGRLVGGLEPRTRARTTVLFLADNGSESCVTAPPSNRAKSTLYEGGIHVPLIAAGYRVGRGVSRAPVLVTDVFATVAELAGVDARATLPGRALDSISFVAALEDPRAQPRNHLYAEQFTPNGSGNPRPLPGCPTNPLCQLDLGFDGPGSSQLASCGQPLYGTSSAHSVPVEVRGGPSFAAGTLRIGAFAPVFDPTLGATLVSSAPVTSVPFVLDGQGAWRTSLWTGTVSRELHYQAVVADPTQPLGASVTNALRLELLWTDAQAASDGRYKLLRHDPCDEEFYDLALDPHETVNLLTLGLDPAARAAYERLTRGLELVR